MQFDHATYQSRLSRLSASFAAGDIQALILFDMYNIRYFTGFTGSDGALVVRPESLTLLVDGRYLTQAREEVQDGDIFLYQDQVEGIGEVLASSAGEKVGFEATAVSFALYLRLSDRLGSVRLIPLSGELDSIRAVKDDGEISRIRQAAELSARVLEAACATVRPGIAERDVAREIDFSAISAGAERMAFETIVASGKNAALPHAKPGRKSLEPGDLIVIDYGTVVDGYCSDETCTFCLGFADDRKREAYAAVKEAHDRALEAVRAGVAGRQIDRIARSVLERYGLDACFTHGTGHGVGLEVHEAPRISSRSDTVLREGMVITIEPGVYIPGQWGIRIEDTVLVRADGCEILTKMPKELIIL